VCESVPRTKEKDVTEEQHDEREAEPESAEPEASEAAKGEEPDFELHGQPFNEPSK